MKRSISWLLLGLLIFCSTVFAQDQLIDDCDSMLYIIDSGNMQNVYSPDTSRYYDYEWFWQRQSGQPGQATSGHLVYYLESLQTVEIVFFRHDNTAVSQDGKMTHVKLYTSESESGPWEALTYQIAEDEATGLAWHLVRVVAQVQDEANYLQIEIAEPAQFWHPKIARVVLAAHTIQ